MQASKAVQIPQAVTWLLRLAADEDISTNFRLDAVAFAGWYAVMGQAMLWPAEVEAIQLAERTRKLSLDRMMKLLGQVNYAFAGRTTTDHARRVLEGYAVHDWVKANFRAFRDLAATMLKSLAEHDLADAQRGAGGPPFSMRLRELGRALRLSDLESDILAFAFLTAASEEIAGVFEQLAADRWTAERIWTVIFNTSREHLAKAMRPRSPLRLSGLLRPSDRHTQLAGVTPFWINLLASADDLFEAVLEPLPAKLGSGMPARLLGNDLTLATDILRNAKGVGINLLLYGAPSLEKRQLLRRMVADAGRSAWHVRKFEEAGRHDLPSLTYVAFRLLADVDATAVLVVEHPSDVLQTAPSAFIKALFGIELSNDDIPAFDEHLLDTNAVPGVWLESEASGLPEDTIARFVFHAPLKKADKAQRTAAVIERLQGMRLSKKTVDELLTLDGVSSAQLDSALKAAKLSGARTKKEREAAMVQAVRRSQRVLSRDLQAKLKPSVTQYSLKYLSTAGRFTPEKILECFRVTPKGTVVLYGPSGTGKTQFVEHMAAELGMPLLAKRASELLDKYVGGSEKNLAAAFEEAATSDSLLMLDEGDSFLRDRSFARQTHEISQVNELLQLIERFEGIVVVCTNLFQGLDAAVLRRFTFKVEFRELDSDQRWEMFLNETGMKAELSKIAKAEREGWWETLCLMRQLTPGDFATVKRQCILLRTQLSPKEWLEQLQIECDVRRLPSRDISHD